MAEVEPERLSWWRTLSAGSFVISCTLIGRLIGILGIGMSTGRLDPFAEDASQQVDGFLLATGILGASLTGGLALLLIVRKRSPLRYLALEAWNAKHIALGVLASLLLVLVFDAARYVTTGSVTPSWMETYRSAASVPMLAIALIVVAPLFEECLFRGFLQPGLAASRLQPAGAIFILSILFMLAHRPTDVLSALEPLASGMLLGVFRHQTKSTTTGIVMHAFGNLLAIAPMAMILGA